MNKFLYISIGFFIGATVTDIIWFIAELKR